MKQKGRNFGKKRGLIDSNEPFMSSSEVMIMIIKIHKEVLGFGPEFGWPTVSMKVKLSAFIKIYQKLIIDWKLFSQNL